MRLPVKKAAQLTILLARMEREAPPALRRPRLLSDRLTLHAAGPGELSGLEAFLTEDWTPLRRSEGHRRLFPTCRARGRRLYAFASNRTASRTTGTLAFAGLAALRFVLEVFVGEKLLLPGRPDKLCATVHALEHPVLELHRSLPRRVGRFLAVAAGRSAFVVSAPVIPDRLLQLPPELLAIAFSCQRLLGASLVARLQVK